MSIIIKGMKMQTARDTLVLVKTDGTAIVYVDEAYVTTAYPVPPHGRLIDAEALRQDLKDSIDECHNWADAVEPDTTMYARISQAFGTFVECSLRVKAAPTVIEAEEEEE